MIARFTVLAAPLALLALAGCTSRGEIDPTGGITAVRSVCPAVGVPAGTGDITLFSGGQQTADAIDLTATLTNVRSTCVDSGDPIVTTVTFDVLARRTRTEAAQQVTLPYFVTVTQGGTAIVAKRVGQVTLSFAAGQERAQAQASVNSYVTRASATLDPEVRSQIIRPRKAGEEDAASDPLANPAVRQAVLRATFETLVGFQLTDDQLKYNVTR